MPSSSRSCARPTGRSACSSRSSRAARRTSAPAARPSGQRLAEAYRAENTTLLEQVFTAESFTDVMSQAYAYLAYGDQDAQMADDIAEDQQALDALRLVTTSTRLRTDQLRRATIEIASTSRRAGPS